VFVEGFEGVVVAAADADVAAQGVDPAVAVEREASQEKPDFGDLDGANHGLSIEQIRLAIKTVDNQDS
jgi:hypothetical protein